MNELIEQIFEDFTINGVKIPVRFLFYEGHGEPYITYMQMDADNSYAGDNELLGYADYYDFDVYSRGNYTAICDKVKKVLGEHGFIWEPSKSSADMWESETGYYHKTLNFAIHRQREEENG